MRLALNRLYSRIKPGSVALIFFSGYGIQSGRQSYLIPVDAQIWTEADVRRDGFSLETILGEINNRGAGVKIALLDASRRNPFERRFRSFSAGLAPVIAPSGTLVMYSAALSSVVSDAGTDHSLFVSELLKEIRVPDLTRRGNAEPHPRRRDAGVARRAGAVDFVVSGRGFLFYSRPARQTRRGRSAAVAATPGDHAIAFARCAAAGRRRQAARLQPSLQACRRPNLPRSAPAARRRMTARPRSRWPTIPRSNR